MEKIVPKVGVLHLRLWSSLNPQTNGVAILSKHILLITERKYRKVITDCLLVGSLFVLPCVVYEPNTIKAIVLSIVANPKYSALLIEPIA